MEKERGDERRFVESYRRERDTAEAARREVSLNLLFVSLSLVARCKILIWLLQILSPGLFPDCALTFALKGPALFSFHNSLRSVVRLLTRVTSEK